MFKVLEEEKPEYLTVAFDVHAPTFRHKMYEEYKGTRKPMAEELRQQVPVIKEVLQTMGVKIVEKEGLEADDILGTLSKRCENAGMEAVVLSGDRDLLQLATQHVKIRIPKTKQGRTEVEDYYEEDVKERYQVTPSEFIDLKALMGDSSDNIPGVPSIGEKTATKIIVEYGSIENAYEHVDELKPPRASKALKEHYDMAQMSKVLATIEVQADFPYAVEDARLGNLYTPEAYAMFQKLQFKNLLGRFDVDASVNALEDYFKQISSKDEAEKIIREASQSEMAGVSIFRQTKNVLPLFADAAGIGGIAVAYGKKKIYILTTGDNMDASYLMEAVERIAAGTKMFSMFDIKEILHHIKIEDPTRCFDARVGISSESAEK